MRVKSYQIPVIFGTIPVSSMADVCISMDQGIHFIVNNVYSRRLIIKI